LGDKNELLKNGGGEEKVRTTGGIHGGLVKKESTKQKNHQGPWRVGCLEEIIKKRQKRGGRRESKENEVREGFF